MSNLDRTLIKLLVWFVIAFVAIVPLERSFPLKKRSPFRAGFTQDIFYYFSSGIIPAFLLVVIYAVIGKAAQSILPAGWLAWVQSLPIWVRLLSIAFIGDLGFYWAHRWAHEVPLLWKFHAIHHSPELMDWLVATRTHPFEIAYLRGMSAIPLFALGLVDLNTETQSTALLFFVVFNTFWGFFIHSNVSVKLGWLSSFISTPLFHHWHHAASPAAARNKNYASLFPVLDKIFHSYYDPSNAFPENYGSSTRVPRSFLAQLLVFGKKERADLR